MKDFSGVTINQRYKIEKLLGVGGMAEVFLAYDLQDKRQVALKMLNAERQQSKVALKRFEREVKALLTLQHPSIIPVFDTGTFEECPYLVMEYVPGGTLSQVMGKPLSSREAAQILLPIAQALAYAHSQGVIHRDVKPGNILLTSDKIPLLSDFGIAKMLQIEATTELTRTGFGIGTPAYMAPEQSLGKDIDARADVFALGVVFYELVTGSKPFNAPSPLAILRQQKQGEYTPPQNLPQTARVLIQKSLAPNPNDRFINMPAMIEVMQKLLANESIPEKVAPKKISKPTPKPQNEKPGVNKVRTWAVASVIITILILGFGIIQRLQNDTNQNSSYKQSGASPDKQSIASVDDSTNTELTKSIELTPTIVKPSPTATEEIVEEDKPELIAFSSDKTGIFQINTLTTDNIHEWTAWPVAKWYDRSWWPTFCGDWIFFEAYSSSGARNQWIYFVDTRTTNDASAWEPPDGGYYLGVPRCSAGNEYLAYTARADTDHYELRVVDADEEVIFNMRSANQRAANALISGYASFSKDGKRFTSIANSARDSFYEVFVTDNFNNTRFVGIGMYASLSPNGEKIAYNCNENKNICLNDLSGNKESVLIDIKGKGKLPSGSPVWSSNGRWIYFASAEDGDFDIYRIRLDGSQLGNLTQDSIYNEITPAVKW